MEWNASQPILAVGTAADGMRTGNYRALAAALAVLLLLVAVGVRSQEPALPQPLPRPRLEGMSAEVREQIERSLEAVEVLRTARSVDRDRLSQAYGDLGGMGLLYGLLSFSVDALERAAELDGANFRWPYLLGFAHQAEGHADQAVAAYKRALELHPGFMPALVRLGDVYLDLRRPGLAAERYQRALAVQPAAAAAYYGLGKVALARDQDEEAVKHFYQALELQPQASAIRFPLAQALRRLGNGQAAAAQLAEFGHNQVAIPDPVLRRLRSLGTGAAIHAVRGQRALDGGDLQLAINEFQQALEGDPDNVPVRRMLALCLRKTGDLETAIDHYRKAAQLEPANALNHQDLALALSEQGVFEEAIGAFRQALAISSDFQQAKIGLGIALARAGRVQQALRVFDEILERDPLVAAVHFERSMALVKLGRLDEARTALNRLLNIEPDHVVGRVNLIRLLELNEEYAAASQQIQLALAQEPEGDRTAGLYLAQGRIAERRGQFAVARDAYTNAIATSSRPVRALLRRASVMSALEDYDAAFDDYTAALGTQPLGAIVYLAAASAALRAGRDDRARDLLEKGLSRNPAVSNLAAVLALVYASSERNEVRDAARARELARTAVAALNDLRSGQILAMALAESGLHAEAVRTQERIVRTMEQSGVKTGLAAARERLVIYRASGVCRAPWQKDRSLIPSPSLPLPGVESR